MFSLLEALTLAPMRTSQFLEVGHTNAVGRWVDRAMARSTAAYRRALEFCLRHRWKVVGASLALFIGSLSLGGIVKKELMPPQDQNMLFLRVETPVGSSLAFTDRTL